jgi:hypothetical protein
MKYIFFSILILCFSQIYAQEKQINYEYKKFESFDFDEIGIDGSENSPGDLSISPRFRKEFKNRIPERKNFNKEINIALDAIK